MNTLSSDAVSRRRLCLNLSFVRHTLDCATFVFFLFSWVLFLTFKLSLWLPGISQSVRYHCVSVAERQFWLTVKMKLRRTLGTEFCRGPCVHWPNHIFAYRNPCCYFSCLGHNDIMPFNTSMMEDVSLVVNITNFTVSPVTSSSFLLFKWDY